MSPCLSGDFSFTPYTTYFYVKPGTRAPLLRDPSHTVSMKTCTSLGRGPSEVGDVLPPGVTLFLTYGQRGTLVRVRFSLRTLQFCFWFWFWLRATVQHLILSLLLPLE